MTKIYTRIFWGGYAIFLVSGMVWSAPAARIFNYPLWIYAIACIFSLVLGMLNGNTIVAGFKARDKKILFYHVFAIAMLSSVLMGYVLYYLFGEALGIRNETFTIAILSFLPVILYEMATSLVITALK